MSKYNIEAIGGFQPEEDEWEALLGRLPGNIDLEKTAKENGALKRRREIGNAGDLLRLILGYAVCDWSLRMAAMWCAILGLGSPSGVAVRKRLIGSRKWLGVLIGVVLQAHVMAIEPQDGVRLRFMDATCVSIPGSTGTDWRLHISLDVGSMCIDGVEVTDQHSGETFAHFPSRPGDIRIGDRGYAFAKSIGPVLAEGGWVVVRITWQNLPLESAEGQRIDVPQLAQQLTSTLAEWEVYLPTEQGRFQMRLALAALPQEAADKARCRIRKIYRKKGKTPDKRTLLTAGFIMVITNLPMAPWSTLEVLKLYRTRWQIELLFKRLKSILRLDHLRAFDSDLAQVYLLAKILAALLSEQFIQKIKLRYPAWFSSTRCPISFWRLTALSFDWLVQTVRGHITHAMILHALPLLARFLCDPPRKRPSQLAQLSFLLSNLSSAL